MSLITLKDLQIETAEVTDSLILSDIRGGSSCYYSYDYKECSKEEKEKYKYEKEEKKKYKYGCDE